MSRASIVGLWLVTLMTLGIAVGTLVDRYTRVLPPSRIATCWLEPCHRFSHCMHVTTEAGTVVHDDFAYRCPAGERIEKRRGEAFYRVDGEPLTGARDVWLFSLLLLFFGTLPCALVLVGTRDGFS